MKNNKSEPIPVMDYRQYRRVRRLVHECCNYIDGNCIALDDGEECVCVVQGMVSTIITQSGSSGMSSVSLPQELIDAINNVGFWIPFRCGRLH